MAEVVYRFTPNEHLRFSLALGARTIDGKGSRSGVHGGGSLGLYPWRWLGFETDLRWADIADRTLGDYRAGALLRLPGFPYVAVRGGYRGIHYQSEWLHGGEVGLVLTW